MAIIKHIPTRNASYVDALQYLTFKHDEQTGKPLKDENDNLIMREDYRLDGINCEPWLYAMECAEVNSRYHKNQGYGDVKSHHYILSFDPRDTKDHGLTLDKAQELGLQLAQKFFSGHQVLVCAHPDGDNQSGNIHVHIVMNSIAKYDVKKQSWMQKKCEWTAGYKLRDSAQMMHAIKQYVMDMCIENGLYQQDLFKDADDKVTDREYRQQQRGQNKQDKKNEKIKKDGFTPKYTEYNTQKNTLRKAIHYAAYKADSYEDFIKLLKDKNIEIVESRGKWGYRLLDSDRAKPIRARQLGAAYEKESVLSQIYTVKSITDIHASKWSKQYGYANEKINENIQRSAATLSYMTKHGFSTINSLKNRIMELEQLLSNKSTEYTEVRKKVNILQQTIKYTGAYYATKSTYGGLKIAPNPKAYRAKNQEEIRKHEEARAWLKKHYEGEKFRTINDLKDEIAGIYDDFDRKYENSQREEDELRELRSVLYNMEKMTGHENIDSTNRRNERDL